MDKIRLGIVGVGSWGRVHAEVYSTHDACSLHAVCDLEESRAREVAAAYGARKVYTDYNEMMCDPEIDAVAVVTPDFAHCGPIVAAARPRSWGKSCWPGSLWAGWANWRSWKAPLSTWPHRRRII